MRPSTSTSRTRAWLNRSLLGACGAGTSTRCSAAGSSRSSALVEVEPGDAGDQREVDVAIDDSGDGEHVERRQRAAG